MKIQCTRDEKGKILYLIEVLIAESILYGRKSIPSSKPNLECIEMKESARKSRNKAKKELLITLGLYKPRAKK